MPSSNGPLDRMFVVSRGRFIIGILITLALMYAGAVAGQVTVELYSERSPFTQVSSTNSSGGEATLFVQQVLDGADIPYSLSYLPWRRAYAYALSRRNIAIYPMARTGQRESLFHWVGQLIPVNYYLFRLKSRDDIKVLSLEDAKQYRVGVVNHHVHHELLTSLGFSNLQPVNSNVQNLKKALLGRIDLFPISDGGLVPLCLREGIDCSQFEPILKLDAISGGLYLVLGPDTSETLVEAAKVSYQRLVADGTHAAMFRDRLEYAERFNTLWPLAAQP